MTSSPVKPDSQILSLIEALSSTKKELDSQGLRVRRLEELLKQERRAREIAEEQARILANRSKRTFSPGSEPIETETNTSDQDMASTILPSSISDQEEDHDSVMSNSLMSSSPVVEVQITNKETPSKEVSKTPAQEKLDILIREMDEMKILVESYKRRAESAEEEKRTTLAEMVEHIRKSEGKIKSPDASLRKRKSMEMSTQTERAADTNGSAEPKAQHDDAKEPRPTDETNGALDTSTQQIKQLQHALATALSSRHHDDRLAQSAPYASILGVVLIGVGLMTYLNGWPKVER